MRSVRIFHVAIFTTAAALNAAPPDSNNSRPTPVSAVNGSLPSWVRLSGELRARSETFLGNRFTGGEDDTYLLQRVRLAVELKPLPYLQFFAQAQDSRVSFTDRISPAPPYQDSADLRQAWFQIGGGEKSLLNLRVGRQELAFGEERLVGASNWGNVARTFDAVKLVVQHNGYGATVFTSSVVAPRDHAFDRHVDGDNLHGIYGSITRVIPQATIEPYTFWRIAPRVESEAGGGRLDSKTTGFRFAGKLPYAAEYTAEMAIQRGSWGGDSVAAWAGFWRIGRTFGRSELRPTLRLEMNHASGDKDPNDRHHGTFDVLYPTAHDKYGLADQVGWKNVNHIGFIGEVKPKPQLTLQAKFHNWWLDSARDGLYNSGGALLVRDRSGSAGTHVGEEIDVQASWAPMSGLQIAGGVGHIFPGEFLRHATPGDPYTFVYTTLVYGF